MFSKRRVKIACNLKHTFNFIWPKKYIHESQCHADQDLCLVHMLHMCRLVRVFLLSACRNVASLAMQNVPREDSDQNV